MTTLRKYEAACRALAEAHSLDEVKDVRDKAEAMRLYARQAKNVDLEIQAADLRLHAERKLGELLIEARDAGKLRAGQPRKNGSNCEPLERIKLADFDIDKKFSTRLQRLGHIAPGDFETLVARTRETIRDRGSRIAFAAINTMDKQRQRENRERVLGTCQAALPNKKYGVIVADPEWRFEPWSRETGLDRSPDNHYPTSCTEVIAARDVPSIAADDCVLFLWATVPMLPHALLVMAAWGFDYRSHYVWGKNKTGTGYWNRNKHELLLIGVRGKIPAPAPGTQWDSLILAPVTKHSAKPECFLEMIEKYFPTLPKIELNRRGPARPGWKAWGNEATERDATTNPPPASPEPAPSTAPQINGAGSPFPDPLWRAKQRWRDPSAAQRGSP